ncbi:MAG: 16S rRNA (uracil(1498)-N(3))-methyltransferase, partial [Pseudomonadota bacterium]
RFELTNPLFHYVANVLRLKEGQSLVLFNGDGCDYPSELCDLSKKSAEVIVDSQLALNVESPLHIHLMQAVSKGDRMDYALQKSVELGVSKITPITTENCNVKLSDVRWQKKVEQWQKIVVSACEQSGRNVVPKVAPVASFHQSLGINSDLQKVILAPRTTHYLSKLAKPKKGFMLLVGPEGGFSEKEIYNAEQRGFTSCNIGPRVLRTETAAVTGLSVLQTLFGDL